MAHEDAFGEYFMNALPEYDDDIYDNVYGFFQQDRPKTEQQKVLFDSTRCNEGYCFHFCADGRDPTYRY